MISGNFKKWQPIWANSDNTVRVEKTQPSYKDKKEDEESITIDITIDEETSETEDFSYDDITETHDIIIYDTITVVNDSISRYNIKGKLEKLKIKNNTLIIV
jgi:hypothetical protein